MNYRNIHNCFIKYRNIYIYNCGTKELYNYLKLLRQLTYTKKTYITDVDRWLFIHKTYITDVDIWLFIYKNIHY